MVCGVRYQANDRVRNPFPEYDVFPVHLRLYFLFRVDVKNFGVLCWLKRICQRILESVDKENLPLSAKVSTEFAL
jgi:hypothetical protein